MYSITSWYLHICSWVLQHRPSQIFCKVGLSYHKMFTATSVVTICTRIYFQNISCPTVWIFKNSWENFCFFALHSWGTWTFWTLLYLGVWFGYLPPPLRRTYLRGQIYWELIDPESQYLDDSSVISHSCII